MLNSKYLSARNIVRNTKDELTTILESISSRDRDSIENNKAFYHLEYIIDKLDSVDNEFKYLNSDVKEGTLQILDYGKYFIAYDDGTESYPLSCGHGLEMWDSDEEEWIIGRVEYNKGYYFVGRNKPYLFNGMRVRKRQI